MKEGLREVYGLGEATSLLKLIGAPSNATEVPTIEIDMDISEPVQP